MAEITPEVTGRDLSAVSADCLVVTCQPARKVTGRDLSAENKEPAEQVLTCPYKNHENAKQEKKQNAEL